jgi:hypothetical protein
MFCVPIRINIFILISDYHDKIRVSAYLLVYSYLL